VDTIIGIIVVSKNGGGVDAALRVGYNGEDDEEVEDDDCECWGCCKAYDTVICGTIQK
jgi:hypothetical protein